MSSVRIVIGVTAKLNYYQHRHTRVRGLAGSLSDVVKECDVYGKVGFVSLPFSQSQSLFTNCLLYHEAGHFVFEERSVADKILKDVIDSINAAFSERQLANRVRSWLTRSVISWLEELFADIVAVKLLGPAYTLAALALTELLNDISSEQFFLFYENHPPDALRFREQLKSLQGCPEEGIPGDGWQIEGEPWRQLAQYARIEDGSLRPPSGDPDLAKEIWQKLMGVFFEMRIRMHELAEEVLQGRQNPHAEYDSNFAEIKECLSSAIVPSTLGRHGVPILAPPTAVINAAAIHWVEEMDCLFSMIPSKRSEKVEDRAFLQERLELWAMKAVEDWLLMHDREDGIQWPL